MHRLSRKVLKYGWVYERENGDRGIVFAKTRDEAIDKLTEMYPDAKQRIIETDESSQDICDWMYVFPIKDVYNGYGQGFDDVFIVESA